MPRPNILLITVEELRGDMTGYAGCKEAETPFLDNMSAKGVTFTNHFTVHSKCVPSRCAWFSGRYPHVDGHRTLGIQLQENEINLAKILRDNGYYNIIAGKNHVVEPDEVFDSFDEFWTKGVNGEDPFMPRKYTADSVSRPITAGNKYADNYLLGELKIAKEQRTEWAQKEKAIKFFKEHDKNQPFFMNLNYQFTHPPYNVMEPYYSRFVNKKMSPLSDHPGKNKPDFFYKLYDIHQGDDPLTQKDRDELKAVYLGMLAFVDDIVNETVKGLEDAGIAENTIVIFTSDHGDFVGQYGCPEKWDTIFHDCLLNIPLIFYWPGKLKPQVFDQLTENIDCMPTLLELLDIEMPYGVQGKSMLPLITGETDSHKDFVFAEGGHEPELLDITILPEEHNAVIVGYQKKALLRHVCTESLVKSKMIRTKDAKFVYRVNGDNEYYNLTEDPEELNNIYNQPECREAQMELKDILLNHLINTEQNLPFDPHPIA